MNVDKYIKSLDSPIQEIVIELREIVRNSSDSILESIKWNAPTYSINSNICSIMAHKEHVNLQIFLGAHIEDVSLLEGGGKDMRHIKITRKEDINGEQLKVVLAQAIVLDK